MLTQLLSYETFTQIVFGINLKSLCLRTFLLFNEFQILFKSCLVEIVSVSVNVQIANLVQIIIVRFCFLQSFVQFSLSWRRSWQTKSSQVKLPASCDPIHIQADSLQQSWVDVISKEDGYAVLSIYNETSWLATPFAINIIKASGFALGTESASWRSLTVSASMWKLRPICGG